MTGIASKRRRRLRLQLVGAAALLLSGLSLLFVSGDLFDESAAERAKRLSSEHGIRVAFGDPKSFFVPPYNARDARLPYVEMTATDEQSAATCLKAVERSLQQYPAGFVPKLIGAIFIAGDVLIGGADTGGTVGPAWIILAGSASLGREGLYATSLIGVHHELSSFVYRKQPDTLQRWATFTPPDWKYKTDPKEMIALADGAVPKPETGFLSAYGSSNEENDFNVYAEKMFTEPETVARLAWKHELIRRKLDFAMAAYVAVDRRMKAVFRELRLYKEGER